MMTSPNRIPLVVGNWKMNTSLDEALNLAEAANSAAIAHPEVEVGILPPAVWLVPLAHRLGSDAAVLLGAQDVAAEPSGAFTGDLSAEMLTPYARLMLTGHSERRHGRGESDALIRAKLDAIHRVGRTPILAVGETEAQRRSGRATAVVAGQLDAALGGRTGEELERLVIAYEPVWAIGTGNAATADDAAEMADLIRSWLRRVDRTAADRVRILYGGSMNAQNAREFLAVSDIDGGLIGGASLKPSEFAAIVDAAGTSRV